MSAIFSSQNQAALALLKHASSASIESSQVAWQECGADGFWIKPLFNDQKQGLRTWLMKVDAGAFSDLHSHDEIEQIYVLEGSFYDQHKTYQAGDFIIRAPGAEHTAGSEEGALVLLLYSSPLVDC